MMCRYCGSSLPDGALFCGECGRAVYVDEARSPLAASSSVIVPVARSVRGPAAAVDPFREPVAEPVAEPGVPDLDHDAPVDDDALDDDGWDDDGWDDIDEPAAAVFSIADLAVGSTDDAGSSDDIARCPQCGEPMAEGDVFCGECGFVLRTVSPPTAEQQSATDLVGPEDASIILLPDLIHLGSIADAPAEADATTEIEPLPADEHVPHDIAAEPDDAADVLEEAKEPEPGARHVQDEPSIDELHREPAASVTEAPVESDPDLEFDEPLPFALPKSKPTPVTRARPIPDPFPWGIESNAMREDIEKTRIVGDTASGTRFVLQFSTGESVTVLGSGLVGRNPSMQPGEYVDQLVPIFDAGKSVSKTHLEFGQEAGRFWVSDRYSTNGSVIRQPDTEPRRCDSGRRYFVARGTRVDVGEQFFVVS